MATPHNFFPLFSGPRVTRDLLGLPLDWATISSWLDPTIGADIPPPLAQAPLKKKCPEIPALPNYRSRPPNSFWSTFPSQSLPEGISTQINIKVLKAKVANMTGRWTSHQKERAARAIKDLSQGASAFQGAGPAGDLRTRSKEGRKTQVRWCTRASNASDSAAILRFTPGVVAS